MTVKKREGRTQSCESIIAKAAHQNKEISQRLILGVLGSILRIPELVLSANTGVTEWCNSGVLSSAWATGRLVANDGTGRCS